MFLRPHAVSYQHVHGHVGEVANELADGLAGIASLGRCSTAPFAIALERWLAENALAARWLPHVCLTRVHPEALPELRQGVLSWPLQAPPDRLPAELSIAPFMRPLQQPSTQAHTVSRLCNWTAVTFNALSLLSADVATPDGVEEGTGLYGTVGRIALLEAALAEVDVFIAGIQEARTYMAWCEEAVIPGIVRGAMTVSAMALSCGLPMGRLCLRTLPRRSSPTLVG
eukprot:s2731_g4.t1